jgi:hypothetical protein
MKENVEEGPMMANTELLEAWISSVRQIWSLVGQIRLLWCSCRVQVTQSYSGQTEVTQRILRPNYKSGETGVRLGKANSVLDKANGVSRVGSGLPGLA